MATIREQILQAVCAAIINNTPAAERVFRSRVQALTRDEMPAIVVKPGDEDVVQFGGAVAQRALEIKVEFIGHGDPADQLLDPVIAAAHSALAANASLGGLLQQFKEKSTDSPVFDDNDDSTGLITVTYLATYLTPVGDLTRLAR